MRRKIHHYLGLNPDHPFARQATYPLFYRAIYYNTTYNKLFNWNFCQCPDSNHELPVKQATWAFPYTKMFYAAKKYLVYMPPPGIELGSLDLTANAITIILRRHIKFTQFSTAIHTHRHFPMPMCIVCMCMCVYKNATKNCRCLRLNPDHPLARQTSYPLYYRIMGFTTTYNKLFNHFLLHFAYHCTPTAPHTSSPCMLNFFAIKQIFLSPLPNWNFDFQNKLLCTCDMQVKSKNC